MAQLSDDCFAFGGPMMSVDEAVGIIAARVTAVGGVEIVALTEADGRILAKDISATLPLPPFTNSAVDGYAVRSRDLPQQGEAAFAVAGRVQAGASASEAIQPGHVVRIFTGAPMPDGADTVFMQEDVRVDQGGRVVLPPGLKPGANVRPAGEDIPAGHAALKAGRRLRPQDVAPMSSGASASRCSRPATNWYRPGARARPRNCSIPTASCCWRCFAGSAAKSAISGFCATIAPRWPTA
jgi:molybdopterin molybdotransferase